MSPFFLVQTAADAILLTLCALDLFRERLRRKDLLLPLLYAVMVAISRIRFTHSMDPLRTLLLPVDSLLCLFYLFILVLLLNSSWFSAPEGHTLWGTFLQLALFLLFRTGSAALLSVVRLDSGPWLICGTCLLSFLPWAALHTSGLMDWLQQRLAEGDIALQLLSVSTFVVLLLPWMLQLRRFGDYPWTQTALLLILLTGLDGAILMREQRQITQRRNMQFLEQYLPMVEELVESVRARQHAFSNRMMAVSAAVSTADTLEEAQQAVRELAARTALEPADRELLRCDSKVLSGMLFGKIRQAELRHIQVEISLSGGFLRRSLPEWDWVEVIGVLLDNAMEASGPEDIITVRSAEEDGALRFTVSNPCPPRSAADLASMFRRGWSTKSPRGRGYGLFNVRRLVERRGGRMVVRNEPLHGRNCLTIGAIVP